MLLTTVRCNYCTSTSAARERAYIHIQRAFSECIKSVLCCQYLWLSATCYFQDEPNAVFKIDQRLLKVAVGFESCRLLLPRARIEASAFIFRENSVLRKKSSICTFELCEHVLEFLNEDWLLNVMQSKCRS